MRALRKDGVDMGTEPKEQGSPWWALGSGGEQGPCHVRRRSAVERGTDFTITETEASGRFGAGQYRDLTEALERPASSYYKYNASYT